MKVLLIGTAGRYGAQLSLLYLSCCLKQQGVEPVIILPEHGQMEEMLNNKSITHYIIKNGLGWYCPDKMFYSRLIQPIKFLINQLAEIRLWRIIKKERIDIVHLNSIGIVVGVKAAKWCGKKVVCHIREFVEEDLNRCLYSPQKTYQRIHSADAVIGVSKAICAKYRDWVCPEKMYTIYNGIDQTVYGKFAHEILTKSVVKVVMMGRICLEKGQRELIHALQRLKTCREQLEVYLAGDGNGDDTELEKLHLLIKESGLEKQIFFCGYQKDIAGFLADKDICVMASRMEAFGRSTVEAMMAGLLVIGADSGGTSELLGNGNGILYPSGDDASLAHKIESVLEDRKSARAIADHGMRNALMNYTADRNAEEIRRIYEKISDSSI